MYKILRILGGLVVGYIISMILSVLIMMLYGLVIHYGHTFLNFMIISAILSGVGIGLFYLIAIGLGLIICNVVGNNRIAALLPVPIYIYNFVFNCIDMFKFEELNGIWNYLELITILGLSLEVYVVMTITSFQRIK